MLDLQNLRELGKGSGRERLENFFILSPLDFSGNPNPVYFLISGVQKALCRPGGDLVICDEGHRIKNDQANISQALKKIHTRFLISLIIIMI